MSEGTERRLMEGSEAIAEVAEMDDMMGHSTNIDKSKILATTRKARRTAKQVLIRGMKINLANDFKLLGHRCIGMHKYITNDAQEAAVEAKPRTQRIQTLPKGQEGKIGCSKPQRWICSRRERNGTGHN